MHRTAFPATPRDVTALTVKEFTFDLDELDGDRVPSLERVCRTFMDDTNRALVWWIRYAAFRHWRAETDIPTCPTHWTLRDACEVAASFPLNHHWEFEMVDFGFAVEAAGGRRTRAGAER